MGGALAEAQRLSDGRQLSVERKKGRNVSQSSIPGAQRPSIAVLAIALAEYLAGVFPFSPTDGTLTTFFLGSFFLTISWNQLLAIVLVWMFSLLNYRGLHLGSWTQNLLSLSKLAAIAGLLVA